MTAALALHSPRTALVDHIRSEEAPVSVQWFAILGFALLTVLGAQVRIYLWEVPFTLQTLAVYSSGLFLGWRNGLLAQLLYLTLGLFIPVFAGEGYGPAYIFSAASGGYLIAFPLVAALIGLASKRWNSFSGSALSLVCGSVLLFAVGVVWLHYAGGHATWMESIDKGWFRFIPIDLLKIGLTAALYTGCRAIGKE